MTHTPRRLTVHQFRLLLPDRGVLTRAIDAVHVHHTVHPARAEFRGAETIEAMRQLHLAQGWSDIAQHLTIDPLGGLWPGRNWNLPPASVRGHNGTTAKGPFMIALVGNFDDGRDRFDGAQRDSAAAVVAHLLRAWNLEAAAIAFHRDLSEGPKTCPGTTLDRDAFVALVAKNTSSRQARTTRPFSREFLLGAFVTQPAAIALKPSEIAEATIPEHALAGEAVAEDTRTRVAREQRRYSRDFSRLLDAPSGSRGEDWTPLRPHVVNLSRGELSAGGDFSTTPVDLDGIIDAIRDRAAADPSLRILLYAHGGLVGESDALAYAKKMYPWWLSKGVYPVFFVWESGLLEILRQYIVGPRDIFDWTTDPAIELAAKAPGTAIWAGMKESARRASAADLGEGYPGGAHLFASKLAAFLATPAAKDVTVHAIGHSAGAIFHAHLLPALIALGVPRIDTLSFFAPAVRPELFEAKLLALIESKTIVKHACFTMEEDAEEQDNCFKVYRKSLLYLISHSFEGVLRRPILGLHRSIRKHERLRGLYGVDKKGNPIGGTAAAEIQFSYARDKEENPLTRALAHGAFDNDPKTVSAALRRILEIDDESGFGEADFPYDPLPRVFELLPPPQRPMPAPVACIPAGPEPAPAPATPSGGGRRLALCIGIDDYRDRPLSGCVNDARQWGGALGALGFDVRYLLDARATQRGMQDALRDLLAGATPGDVLVMQYSGHGTQLPDDSGDEADGFDEAFVPVDYHTGALFLRDDVVAAALAALPDGVLLTLFMDCCHCGTISRFAPAMRAEESSSDAVRYMPVSSELLAAARSMRAARGSRASFRAMPSSAPGVIHLAACRDNEFAWESNGQGDFTAAAVPLLAGAVQTGETNEAFIKRVATLVARQKRQQPGMMPPAAGMAGRQLLAPRTRDAG
ncbi:MAG: caspase family protein [Vicinamibacterales bacterium]